MTASNLAQLKKEFAKVSKTANARIDSLKRGNQDETNIPTQ